MGFKPISRERVSDRVAKELRRAILEGRYRVGESLPGERQLADALEVNRSTVREALRSLERVGLVETRQGQGSRVCDVLSSATLALLPELLAPGGQLDQRMMADLLDLRLQFNGYAARLAAAREGLDLSRLESLLSQLEQQAEGDEVDLESLQRLDFEFFHELARLSGNRVLVLLMNGFRSSYEAHMSLFAGLYEHCFETDCHRTLLESLRNGQADWAVAAVRQYMEPPLNLLRSACRAAAEDGS